MLDKTLQGLQIFLATQMLKMPIGQMRTRYLEHQDLVSNQQVRSHQDQQLELHHLVHTKLEFCDPTTTDEKYTSRACCRPNQNNVVQVLLVQSLLHRCAPRLLKPLPLVQPLQTTALINVVQRLYRNENNAQQRACMDAFRQLRAPFPLALQQQLYAHRNDPCHQTRCLSQPLLRARS